MTSAALCIDNTCERFALPIPADGCDCGAKRRLAVVKHNVVGDRPDFHAHGPSEPVPTITERFITMLDGRKVRLTKSAGAGR